MFPYQNPVYVSLFSHRRYMPHPSHSSRFSHPKNTGWGVQFTYYSYMHMCKYNTHKKLPTCRYYGHAYITYKYVDACTEYITRVLTYITCIFYYNITHVPCMSAQVYLLYLHLWHYLASLV
jgi:hypothetical protein